MRTLSKAGQHFLKDCWRKEAIAAPPSMALRLVDAELHQRLAIDDRACRVRTELVEPTAEDLTKLAELEASCAL